MKYTPNFQHGSCRQRCEKAVTWVETHIKRNKNYWLSTREIDRHFSNKPLGLYLRNKLLICVNDYYDHSRGICKTYKRNCAGVDYVKAAIGMGDVVLTPNDDLVAQLESGDFDYATKSNRDFHPLQFKPKIQKRPLLKKYGYRHEYDIKAAAHTLLLQHAQTLGLNIPTPAFDSYILDRTQVRMDLALAVGVDTDTIKSIMTALLQGAYITSWHQSSVFGYLDWNINALTRLKNNTYIQQFQRELKEIWRVVKPSLMCGTYERSDGRVVCMSITPRQKSAVYRQLEESVRVVIIKYLNKHKNKHFFEHDGWSCSSVVDIPMLVREVTRQTGFVIQLDWTIHEYN